MLDWDHIFATRSSRMRASEIRELLKLLDQPEIISFAGGIPDPALFPDEEFKAAYADIFSDGTVNAALQYSVSEGYKPLREWLAGEMGKLGIACGAENVFIVSGSQQGLDYLGKLFLSPGDTALVTWPTYLGALQAFNAYEPAYDQLTLAGNRTPESYRAAAAKAGGRVKFAYLTAEFSNPTGETFDRAARERAVADDHPDHESAGHGRNEAGQDFHRRHPGIGEHLRMDFPGRAKDGRRRGHEVRLHLEVRHGQFPQGEQHAPKYDRLCDAFHSMSPPKGRAARPCRPTFP